MSEYAKKTKDELIELLIAADVKVPKKAKKPDLVKLADKHLVNSAPEAPKEGDKPVKDPEADKKSPEYRDGDAGAPQPPKGAKVEVKGKKLEDVRLSDLGLQPSGRFEAVRIGSEGKEEAWRVFGPEGQPVTPVEVGDRKKSTDPKAPGEVLPAHGRAYAMAADQNMHLRKTLGSRTYGKIVDRAVAQGYPR